MSKLGDFLKKERKERNMTLRDFAKVSGLSHTYVSQLEQGYDKRRDIEIVPTIDALAKIAKGLNMNLDKLLYIAGYTNHENSLYNTLEYDDDDKLINNEPEPDAQTIKQAYTDLKEKVADSDELTDEDKELLKWYYFYFCRNLAKSL